MSNSQHGSMTNFLAPIQAPRLTIISRKALETFLATREDNKAAVNAQSGLNPIPWASCINAIYNRPPVLARIFHFQYATIQSLTDDFIKEKQGSLAGATHRVSAEDALVDVETNIRFDASEPGARMRILMLQTYYVELCKPRGWKFLENSRKDAVKHLVGFFNPYH